MRNFSLLCPVAVFSHLIDSVFPTLANNIHSEKRPLKKTTHSSNVCVYIKKKLQYFGRGDGGGSGFLDDTVIENNT